MEGTVKFNLHGISYGVACLVVKREDGDELSLSSQGNSLIQFTGPSCNLQTGNELWMGDARKYAESILSFLDGETKECPFCVGRIGRISSTCEDCCGSGVVPFLDGKEQ